MTDELADSTHEPIPARMLNELVYCPRLYYLEHVAGEWEASSDTISGARVHRRVDKGRGDLPPPDSVPDGFTSRSVTVASPSLGVVAKADLVEADGDEVTPVDYKRGAAPDPGRVPGGVWPADRVQVAAQVLALRAEGYSCPGAVVYYAASKARVDVPVGDAEEAEVRWAVSEARRLQDETLPPPPLVDSPKCPRCSLAPICLPDETNALREPEVVPAAPLRRLIPPDDERAPIYVQTPGSVLGKNGDVLEVRAHDGSKTSLRLSEISHVNVFGAVQVTTGLIQDLCKREIGVSFFSGGGWYYGALGGVATINVQTRIAQFRVASDKAASLALARSFVTSKILNSRTLVRRNAEQPDQAVLDKLKALAEQSEGAQGLDELLGIEGLAARIYFGSFSQLLSPRTRETEAFDFDGRNRRPPRDPLNALLSFGYALLLRDVRVALIAAGFDPTVGFYHQPRPGRPALALDLMEEFRPLLADSAVLSAVNTEVVTEGDFVRAAGAVNLSEKGRKAFTGAYERRVRQEITHPLFGYKLDYRRVLQVQARLLARAVTGEIPSYPGFQTR